MQGELQTKERKTVIDAKSEQKLLLTIPEVAYRLGMGRSYVYELVLKGEISSIKLGRARRVPVAVLEEYVDQRIAEQAVDQ